MKEKASFGKNSSSVVPMRIFLPPGSVGVGFATLGGARAGSVRPCRRLCEQMRGAERKRTFVIVFFHHETFRCRLQRERVYKSSDARGICELVAADKCTRAHPALAKPTPS